MSSAATRGLRSSLASRTSHRRAPLLRAKQQRTPCKCCGRTHNPHTEPRARAAHDVALRHKHAVREQRRDEVACERKREGQPRCFGVCARVGAGAQGVWPVAVGGWCGSRSAWVRVQPLLALLCTAFLWFSSSARNAAGTCEVAADTAARPLPTHACVLRQRQAQHAVAVAHLVCVGGVGPLCQLHRQHTQSSGKRLWGPSTLPSRCLRSFFMINNASARSGCGALQTRAWRAAAPLVAASRPHTHHPSCAGAPSFP